MSHLCNYNITQNSFITLKSLLCFIYSNKLNWNKFLATTDLCTPTIVLPFVWWHIIRIIKYATVSDYLPSLRNMCLRFIYMSFYDLIALYFCIAEYFILHMYHSLFIYWGTSWVCRERGSSLGQLWIKFL